MYQKVLGQSIPIIIYGHGRGFGFGLGLGLGSLDLRGGDGLNAALRGKQEVCIIFRGRGEGGDDQYAWERLMSQMIAKQTVAIAASTPGIIGMTVFDASEWDPQSLWVLLQRMR